MSIGHTERLWPSSVTALFEERAVSFGLSQGATFEDLAARLGNLSRRNHGALVAIAVKFPRLSVALSPT